MLGDILASEALDNPVHFSIMFPEVPVTDPSSSTIATWNSSFLELLSEAYSVVVGLVAIDFQNTVELSKPSCC